MKIKNPVLVGFLSVLGLLTFAIVYPFTIHKKYTDITIEGKTYNVLTAKNPAEWERGLMFVKLPQDYDGMIFYFPNTAPRTFWNMNTLVDLDLVWMQDNKVVGKTYLPSISKSRQVVTVSSPAPANRVVELFRK